MRSLASAAALSFLVVTTTVTADDANQAGVPVGKETAPVTITGCLLAGTRPDTFVLKNVTDSAGRAADVIYWLSTTRGLKDHVGHTIEVTGPVVAVSEGELEVKTDPAKSPDTTIQVKARGKEAKAKTTDETGAEGRIKEEKTMPVHRIKVRSVRMVAPTCR
ncbi:MAG TPA: hypothetical protein VGN09_10755 [Vicinamibacteria bacterium]|jgi:hypothetical protein